MIQIKKTRVFIKILILFVSVLMLFSMSFFIKTCHAQSGTIIVGTSSSANFSSIQEAVVNASDGNIIFVENGVYDERVLINKSVRLFGDYNTIISTKNKVSSFFVDANNTTINGFTFTDSEIAIFVDAGFENNIINNTFTKNKNGIYMINSSYTIIRNNRFEYNSEGVRLFQSSNNKIKNNVFTSQSSKSIYLWEESNSNQISNNNISGDGSILLERWCNKNIISDNYLYELGIRLDTCFNNLISDNHVVHAAKGLVLSYSTGNNVTGNLFENCEICGIYLDNSKDNFIDSNEYVGGMEGVKVKPDALKIKAPGFESLMFLIILVSFIFFKKFFR